MTTGDETPPPGAGIWRTCLRLAAIFVFVLVVVWLTDWAMDRAEAAEQTGLMAGLLIALLLVYAILMAIPFVPGIEIGISLLVLKGAAIAPFVYLATVLGLSLAFSMGRCVRYRWLHSALLDLRLVRAAALVEKLEPMTREERLGQLTRMAPAWLVRPGRYLLVAILLNMPGNALLGGGGGISFISGFSHLFRPVIMLMTIALAVMPVPLTVWLMGTETLSNH